MSPYFVAQTESRLGHRREALKYLSLCVQSHDERVLGVSCDQDFVKLRSDPAFDQLLAKIGLPPLN